MSFSRALSASPISPAEPPIPHQRGAHLSWTGLHGCADAFAIAAAVKCKNRLFVVITPDNLTAIQMERELGFFLEDSHKIARFPDWETLPYDVFSPLPEIVSQRLKTLFRLPRMETGILVVSVTSLLNRIAPREYILANSFELKIGDKLGMEKTRQQLERVGYQCAHQVFQHGEFALRGSIMDLFPMGASVPYRIELFDEEIESMRTFDPDSQRSLEKVPGINLFPAREFPLTDESIKLFRRAFRAQFPDASHLNPVYRDISNGITPGGVEYYLPLFVEHTETIFDYFPEQTTLILLDQAETSASNFYQEVESRYEQRRYDRERPILDPDLLFLDDQSLITRINEYSRIQICDSQQSEVQEEPARVANFATKPLAHIALQPRHARPAQALQDFLKNHTGRTLFVAETAGHREALLDTLSKFEIKPEPVKSWPEFESGEQNPGVIVAPLEHGMLIDQPSLAIVTESQLSGERAQQRRRRKSSQNRDLESIVNNLAELEIGAPVVHRDHGVGRYQGLKILSTSGVETEFLMLEYANRDKLYVPVSSLQLIGRYTGAGQDAAPLHRLGGEQWSKAKRKAMQRVRDVAAELLEINARRAAKKGYAFRSENGDYEAFASAFPFEETPDQETAIQQVVKDMSSDQPMDRVICGDVGFGKTEVAMRAAFLAAQNSRQVAVLVPTTLLAQQHYQNFRDRFADWPIRIAMLSRFVGKMQQDGVVQDTADGKIDILIGTHKLLQKSLQYKRLGLVIIDEEHRFGVNHKEFFKKLRSQVDILTLTATPIPRTLNMAMSGLRNISIIASPPLNRHPIKTFVSEWVDVLVQEACLREIKRGGQVFFLHNTVKTMERTRGELVRLLPEARIEMAHGQMPERKLEQVMLDFYHQRFNLLLCSTIIESGIDVPTANTIIINRADKLGLAQLHQLRGRVGRSHHLAYAYLLIPPKGLLTKDAEKRIDAIEAAGELGAGFMLSSHDLEIRGAGELLGDEQSGQIQEIGFNLYTELLERAISALKSGNQPELETPLESGPEVDLRCPALIPDTYLPDVHTRLVQYKRIASAEGSDELRELQVEMIDRFGLLTEATKNLFETAELKLSASRLGIRKIEVGANGGSLSFAANPNVNPEAIIGLIQSQPSRYKLQGADKLRFIDTFESTERKIAFIQDLLKKLAHAPH